MAQNLSELKQRQLQLIACAAAQRNDLAELTKQLQKPLSWIDKGMAVAQSINAHPKTSAFAALATPLTLGTCFPKIQKWLARGLTAYQLGRSFMSSR